MKLSYILFICIVFFAGFLRFYILDQVPHGLYIDEVSIGKNAYAILKTGKDEYGISHPLLFKSLGDYKLPLYIYAVSISMAIFGKTDFAVRFPSALSGTLTVAVLFFLLYGLFRYKNMLSEKKARAYSLLGMLILAIEPWHVHFSRAGFEVTVAVFFYVLCITLGLYFFLKRHWMYLLGSYLALLLTLYTYHSYTLLAPITFIVGTTCLYLLCPKQKKNIVILAALSFFLSYPMLYASFSPLGQTRFLQTSAFEAVKSHNIVIFFTNCLIFIKNYLSYFSLTYLFRFGDQINRHQVEHLPPLYLWQFPVIIAGIYYLLKSKNSLLKKITLFLLFIAPIPAAAALPSPHTLRMLLASVTAAILTVCGILQMQKMKHALLLSVCLFIVVVFSLASYLHFYYVHYPIDSSADWGGEYEQLVAQVVVLQKKYPHVMVDTTLPYGQLYFSYYAPHLNVLYVKPGQSSPNGWSGKILFVHPYLGVPHPSMLLENIYYKNVGHDIFAQIIHI